MIKTGLERFDSPIVIINQEYNGEEWSVLATYLSEREAKEMAGEGEDLFTAVGWHVSITLPNLDDICFEDLFATAEAALDFGVEQILSGSLSSAAKAPAFNTDGVSQLGHYASLKDLFGDEEYPEPSSETQ